jgi:hemolysin-activating ACP:hemolysin acyltransferase
LAEKVLEAVALTTRMIDQPYLALGIAVHFLSRRQPFAGFRFGDLVQTVDGQIRRRHALFSFEGQRVVGYLGWALCEEEDAREFARTGRPPPPERLARGDVVWLLTAASVTPGALKAMIDAGKSLYPGRRVMGVRYKPTGQRVLFDQTILPRRAGAEPNAAGIGAEAVARG